MTTTMIRELAGTIRECKAQREQIRQLETQLVKLLGNLQQANRECDQWKAEAKWAAEKVIDAAGWIENREISESDVQRARRILNWTK